MKQLYILFFTLVLLNASYAQNLSPTTDKIKSIQVSADNPNFSITLDTNPTTGYAWFLKKYPKQLIEPVKKIYTAPNKKLMGASGQSQWVFNVKLAAFKVPQILTMTFIYVRPWSVGRDSQVRVFHIITVPKTP